MKKFFTPFLPFVAGAIMAALIVTGVHLALYGSHTYPSQALTRGQAAPLIVAVYTAATGEVPPAPDCPFNDIAHLPDDQHKAICQLWGLGIVEGIEKDLLYSPNTSFGEFSYIFLERLALVLQSNP